MRHLLNTKHLVRTTLASAVAAVCFSTSAQAQVEPQELPDDTWLSITGTVTSTTDSSFKLDHGEGIITVEMDDWNDFGDAYPLSDGDKVTVHGDIDQDFFEKATIAASSVYVADLNTFFFASSEDEESNSDWAVDIDASPGDLTYFGTVESVDPSTSTFTIDTGPTELSVDTSGLFYNPLDEEGFQQIDVGDRVSVDAVVDSDFFGDQALLATSIVTLSN